MIGLCAASELPPVGRCLPYLLSLIAFVILQIPTALVKNIAGLMICRFLAGLFGSPPLATGGASVGDVFPATTAPLAIGMWGLAASGGPVLGPLIGGYAVQGFNGDWRWTIWPLLMLSGLSLIILIFSMPETSPSNILLRRAKRLREASGNPHLRAAGEIEFEKMEMSQIAKETFIRPFQLGFLEPIALMLNLHIGMVYGVLYVWFEAFPIVFQETYGFSLGNSGLPYLGIFVGVIVTYGFFCIWFTKYYRPKLLASEGKLAPEYWLHPAMVGGLFLPVSLFAFGWTSNASIHWMVPIVISGLFSVGIFGIFTSGLNYLSMVYPDQIASALACNDFLRAMIGGALPLVASAMFNNLQANGPKNFPVSWGCTLLGCVSLLMAPIPFLLYAFGAKLRKMSKRATDNTGSDDDDEDQKKGEKGQEENSSQEA
jgi:DHA1 family multidrug resistance protein-like MFS transporter